MPLMQSPESDEDARRRIRAKVGDVDHFQVFGNKVLAAIYTRPEVTRGGIFLSSQTVDEDKYQGKVALVLKCGPSAFEDDDRFSFHGLKASPGDWIVLRASDGFPMVLNNKDGDVRLLDDVDVKMTTARPDLVW